MSGSGLIEDMREEISWLRTMVRKLCEEEQYLAEVSPLQTIACPSCGEEIGDIGLRWCNTLHVHGGVVHTHYFSLQEPMDADNYYMTRIEGRIR